MPARAATELALRCYQSSKGQPPARLEDIVPDYLTRVPQDPFPRHALVYHPQGTNWLLYSIGPDGVDNGGRPVLKGSASGDISLIRRGELASRDGSEAGLF